MRDDSVVRGRHGEQGFTLIEAMTAMVILIFGIAAVANLMIVAGTSNTVANHSTAAAAVATQQMELLKSTRFDQLVTGGGILADVGLTGECGVTAAATIYNCTTRATGANSEFSGVGTMHVRWEIAAPVVVGPVSTRFIQVAAESMAPAVGRRSRVVLTTYRTDNP